MSRLQLKTRPSSRPAGRDDRLEGGAGTDPREGRLEEPRDELLEEPQLATSTTASSSLFSRVLVYVLAGAILCGPAGLAISLTRGSAPAPAVAAVEDPNRDARRAAAEDVATRWARAFMSTPAAQADRLGPFWSGPLTLPAAAASVGETTAMNATATAPGVWTVVVAMDVTPAGGAGAQRRYFQVPVAVAGGTAGAQAKPLTVPAEISGPSVSAPGALAYSVTVSSTGAAGVTVHGFLSAYLAGTGDLTRWSAPSLSVSPVLPAPYADVQVAQLQASEDASGLSNGQPSDGTSVHLLATVAMRLPAAVDGQADAFRTGQYLLTVTARAGRWEVSALDASPVVANTSSSTSPTSSTPGGGSGPGAVPAPSAPGASGTASSSTRTGTLASPSAAASGTPPQATTARATP